ncbi:cyclic peptide export ABC transporter [Paenibacillus sp. MZ03-122A]|uniref:cyclic peptide export ABC transporter n=1 Tax=Paenibacillus sp. MZ03-122A TaxID=2962033 RepID=UPI0020B7404F|nr:cyclic peptide export ABC transporter [Paenibacillus sp. MZ03-122A]MCP3778714.1 cyclic peptide export ABC transporter [Paenibacillus sp. MZ03-122A]
MGYRTITKTSLLFLLAVSMWWLPSMCSNVSASVPAPVNPPPTLSQDETEKIDIWIHEQMKKGKIPGTAVVIVKDGKIAYQKQFGYADVKRKEPVTSETLFELGSTSKAFTGLAVLQLQEQGLLKLDVSVEKYLPWFKMRYKGEYRGQQIDEDVKITIGQLLHHTSGISFRTIGDIPKSNDIGALELTVQNLSGGRLDFYPGERFQYATINYDILGLIVQKVSGKSYEDYMKERILTPLGLENTYLSQDEAVNQSLATGYKIGFLRAQPYDAPRYRGNTPAGYLTTNSVDMAKWLNIQLGIGSEDSSFRSLIEQSHTPDRSVYPNIDGSSYGAGWSVFQKAAGELSHGGSNPNYSSFIVFRPEEKLGVAILANLNSAYTNTLGQGIMDILQQNKPISSTSDIYLSVDKVAVSVMGVLVPFSLLSLGYLLIEISQIVRKQRRWKSDSHSVVRKTAISVCALALLGCCIYFIPNVFFNDLPWSFIKVWAPESLISAIVTICAAGLLYMAALLLSSLFPKEKERSFFPVLIASIMSGFGNAVVIFIVNEALNRKGTFQVGLLAFFVAGIILYVFGQRVVRTSLINLTNDMIYRKRTSLIDKILSASYQNIEKVGKDRIFASLNNDTEVISGGINILISGFTSLFTLVCCFVYLGVINFSGLLISIVVILVAAGLYFITGRYANRLWEQTRDIQNTFFRFIDHMVHGYKELSINNQKKNEFKEDVQTSTWAYRSKRILGDLNFANVFVIGELLFTAVIGIVAFLFPILFKGIESQSLASYVFVFLYMTAPVHGILNSIPSMIGVRISWKRLNGLEQELSAVVSQETVENLPAADAGGPFELELKNVAFNYKNQKDTHFAVGPINAVFRSGEITFVTGGNGSGKSTLGKLITGLYEPDEGEILLNGNQVSAKKLGQYFSAVFSDFHLFEKLYGLEVHELNDRINQELRALEIDDKVHVSGNQFSTIRLSTGQRKRLALLVSRLEDRPFYLFDEWAADQDPEFRSVFYHTILPEFKRQGKCVIAITHDDRYFGVADKLIKMEMGDAVTSVVSFAG